MKIRTTDKILKIRLLSNKLDLEVDVNGFVLRDSETNEILIDGSILVQESKVSIVSEKVEKQEEIENLIKFIVK